MSTNQPNYEEQSRSFRAAVMAAIEAAHRTTYASQVYGTPAERAEIAYVNLWDALLKALIDHADCPHAEILGIVAGTLQMRIPIVGTVSGPNAAVSWNSSAGGLL